MSGGSTTSGWRVREDNKPSVTVCTLSMIIIGILMIFAGGLITYIYFTEITPPNYDAYYQRYVGSSFPRIAGILILMAGLTLFWGASIFLVYSNWRRPNSNSNSSDETTTRYYFDTAAETMPATLIRQYADDAPHHHHRTRQQQHPTTCIKENYVA